MRLQALSKLCLQDRLILTHDYYYFKLYDHTSIKVDYSSYQYDKSLKGEFVRLVESDDTLDDITKASIIKIGIDALSGEEFI